MHEAALRAMKQSLTASFRHFFCHSKMLLWDCLHFIQAIPHFWQKKWRRAFLFPPAILNGFLSLKTQNFAVKSNSENRFKYEREYSDECYSRKYVVNSPGNSTSCFISPIRLIGFSLGIINPPSCFLCGRYL